MSQGCGRACCTGVCDLSDDYLLLHTVLEEHEVTIKKLALLTGLAASTLYRFASGGATIPSIVWRALFAETSDQRIIKLLTGEVPCVVAPLEFERLRLDAPTIEHLVQVRQQQLDCEKTILNILADGRIDEKDRAAVAKYQRDFPELIALLYQTQEAITREFRRAVTK